jgi:hypothetical protein
VPLPLFTLNGSYQILPSSNVSLATPTGATVTALIGAEGDLYLSSFAGTQGWVEIHLFVDNNVVRMLRASAVNYIGTNMPNAWHISTIMTLAPGSHDFRVEARTLSATGGPMVVNSVPGSISIAYLRQ